MLLIVFLRKIYFFHLLLPAGVLWRLGEGHEVPPPLQSMTPHVTFRRRHVSSPDSCNTTCFTDQQEVAASPFLDFTIVCLFQLLFSSTCLQLHTKASVMFLHFFWHHRCYENDISDIHPFIFHHHFSCLRPSGCATALNKIHPLNSCTCFSKAQ